jgi:hypothetical protein
MAASITVAEAITKFAHELGCGEDDDREKIISAITEAQEFLQLNGGGDILREWVVPVKFGKSILPRDLETPVKFKWGQTANSGFGIFQSPYLNYSSQGVKNCCGLEWKAEFNSHANHAVVQYQPPKCGVRLVATTRDKKDVGKAIFVSGKRHGMEIAAMHNGFKTGGEYLKVYLEDDPHKKYSANIFDEITGVVRDATCSYSMLSGIDFNNVFHYLSFYHPDETNPRYSQIEFYNCPSCHVGYELCVHILGRSNPSIRYTRDEDIVPIESYEMLKLLAKRARYDDSGDYEKVAAMETRIRVMIKKIVAYQQAPGRQLSVNLKASGNSLGNL